MLEVFHMTGVCCFVEVTSCSVLFGIRVHVGRVSYDRCLLLWGGYLVFCVVWNSCSGWTFFHMTGVCGIVDVTSCSLLFRIRVHVGVFHITGVCCFVEGTSFSIYLFQ